MAFGYIHPVVARAMKIAAVTKALPKNIAPGPSGREYDPDIAAMSGEDLNLASEQRGVLAGDLQPDQTTAAYNARALERERNDMAQMMAHRERGIAEDRAIQTGTAEPTEQEAFFQRQANAAPGGNAAAGARARTLARAGPASMNPWKQDEAVEPVYTPGMKEPELLKQIEIESRAKRLYHPGGAIDLSQAGAQAAMQGPVGEIVPRREGGKAYIGRRFQDPYLQLSANRDAGQEVNPEAWQRAQMLTRGRKTELEAERTRYEQQAAAGQQAQAAGTTALPAAQGAVADIMAGTQVKLGQAEMYKAQADFYMHLTPEQRARIAGGTSPEEEIKMMGIIAKGLYDSGDHEGAKRMYALAQEKFGVRQPAGAGQGGGSPQDWMFGGRGR